MCSACLEDVSPLERAEVGLRKMQDADKAVQEGMDLLDKWALDGVIAPEWWQRVDLTVLDLKDSERCILGQLLKGAAQEKYVGDLLYDEYAWEQSGYSYGADLLEASNLYEDDLGFNTHTFNWNELNAMWTYCIQQRRAGL